MSGVGGDGRVTVEGLLQLSADDDCGSVNAQHSRVDCPARGGRCPYCDVLRPMAP